MTWNYIKTLPSHTYPSNFLCIWDVSWIYICAPFVCLVFRGARRALASPELELQTVTNCQVGASNQTLVLPEHPVFSAVEPSFHPHSHPFKSIMLTLPLAPYVEHKIVCLPRVYSRILTRACCCEIFNIFSVGVEDPILVLVYIPWVVSLVSSLQIYFIICELLYLPCVCCL